MLRSLPHFLVATLLLVLLALPRAARANSAPDPMRTAVTATTFAAVFGVAAATGTSLGNAYRRPTDGKHAGLIPPGWAALGGFGLLGSAASSAVLLPVAGAAAIRATRGLGLDDPPSTAPAITVLALVPVCVVTSLYGSIYYAFSGPSTASVILGTGLVTSAVLIRIQKGVNKRALRVQQGLPARPRYRRDGGNPTLH